MSLTYGSDSNTNMSTLKFDSTGRTVQFTPEESRDFTNFLLKMKAEGKIKQESNKPDNPFHLYMSDYRRDTAIAVTIAVKLIINELVQDIVDLEMTSEYGELLPDAAYGIRQFYNTSVGLSDTASREAMGEYFQEQLMESFDPVDHIQMMQDFINHL